MSVKRIYKVARQLTRVMIGVLGWAAMSCGGVATKVDVQMTKIEKDRGEDMSRAKPQIPSISKEDLSSLVEELVSIHGERQRGRIETGVRQAADKWQSQDGSSEDFKAFCRSSFVVDPEQLRRLLLRFQDNMEQISGHLNEIDLFLKAPTDLEAGPVEPVDFLFSKYDLGSHVAEDLFSTRIAFCILLNFKVYSLEEKLASQGKWTREQWAEARAADMFFSRVPSRISQQITFNLVSAGEYIDRYNIHMHHLLAADGKRLFPKELKLISHWGLRDELKSHYGDKDGLAKQRMIYAVMNRIISQQIPKSVIDNPYVDWAVETNEVRPSTVIDFNEQEYAANKGVQAGGDPEPNTRYAYLLNNFRALRLADPYYPTMPTYIERKFKSQREIPEQEVRDLFTSILASPVMAEVGAFISKRIKRKLEPFDIWYDGFNTRVSYPQEKLDSVVSRKYPSVEAFQKGLPEILGKLGFDQETAGFLSSKIVVDPSRGAGHAWGAQRREASAHLRTRIPKTGMLYKGYNIAIHELGHNVEQVFSLNRMDHNLLEGVPNTAFTEGFAFSFQAKDLELLGLGDTDPMSKSLRALTAIWSTYEMCGVGLIDMEIWKWMYAHPDAAPADLKEAVIRIAVDVWNQYFAPVFGIRDESLLAIYSHIIAHGMYTPDYALGYLIQFQMQEYFEKNGLAKEMERMCRIGSLTPAAWMHEAVGGPISAQPMIEAAQKAIKALGKKKP